MAALFMVLSYIIYYGDRCHLSVKVRYQMQNVPERSGSQTGCHKAWTTLMMRFVV